MVLFWILSNPYTSLFIVLMLIVAAFFLGRMTGRGEK